MKRHFHVLIDVAIENNAPSVDHVFEAVTTLLEDGGVEVYEIEISDPEDATNETHMVKNWANQWKEVKS